MDVAEIPAPASDDIGDRAVARFQHGWGGLGGDDGRRSFA